MGKRIKNARQSLAVSFSFLCYPGTRAFVEGHEAPEGNPVETLQSSSHEISTVKKFCCLECGKELNTKNGLDYHMRTHSGAHPFQCEICLKRFKSSSLCSRHRQIHSSDKKFSCKICGKGFAQKSNLSKHMDIHAGVRPFQCPICPKSFTQKVHLDNHAMTHTKDKPWQCSQCRTRCSFSDNRVIPYIWKYSQVQQEVQSGSSLPERA